MHFPPCLSHKQTTRALTYGDGSPRRDFSIGTTSTTNGEEIVNVECTRHISVAIRCSESRSSQTAGLYAPGLRALLVPSSRSIAYNVGLPQTTPSASLPSAVQKAISSFGSCPISESLYCTKNAASHVCCDNVDSTPRGGARRELKGASQPRPKKIALLCGVQW